MPWVSVLPGDGSHENRGNLRLNICVAICCCVFMFLKTLQRLGFISISKSGVGAFVSIVVSL
jgi:hypothetical protein